MNAQASDAESLPPETQRELIAAAVAARQNAYAAYSKFAVGAALLTADGQIVYGANVENASYGLTICAERVAIHSAVAAGYRQFRALAVVTSGGLPPCGACRQVMAEFCADLPILLVDADRPDAVATTSLAELLPQRFRLATDGADAVDSVRR
ncbi:MAG TPA: cytidine deaminase [Pirellulales bacterium]|jgi:cytidine deaminase